jgi:hypothetical protein
MIGKKVKAFVVQRPIEQGSRKGEMGNEIKTLMPLNDATPSGAQTPSGAATGGAPKAEAVPLY